MQEEEIEEILMDFMQRKFDVLVTTAIIESGIDMPNVNTLIVDRAESFGLSQLYQIRGRVGRSNRQAYCYLFHPPGRVLTELAQKRLNTIMEYQDLGSGFKVAMRDLEIRGAGSILGKEQSGDIMEVGYELYVRMLEEAVNRLKGEKLEVDIRTTINLKTDFYLPEEYIPDVRQRIEFYKRFEAARTGDEVRELAGEMEDRFGKPPELAQTFVLVEMIRSLASFCGFESVFHDEQDRIRFKAGEHFRVPPQHLVALMQKHRSLKVVPGNKDTLFYESPSTDNVRLEETANLLEELSLPLLETRG
jgi:transcription-repair coupling factor (superfamily II helicase)